ncbi:MAG TPA: hypothetical protein VFT22_23875 [Kofleriaceae bacterium]|nr:hypothetical protein [Kofleriaceae bacterium]
MAELRHRLRLAHEATLAGRGIDPRAHDLDRHRATEVDVARCVHHTHASGTEPVLDLIPIDERGRWKLVAARSTDRRWVWLALRLGLVAVDHPGSVGPQRGLA